MITPPTGPATPVIPAWRSRYLPALLDIVIPGLGHLLAGRRKLAAIFGIPFVALLLLEW